jgi:hypothetical protein
MVIISGSQVRGSSAETADSLRSLRDDTAHVTIREEVQHDRISVQKLRQCRKTQGGVRENLPVDHGDSKDSGGSRLQHFPGDRLFG